MLTFSVLLVAYILSQFFRAFLAIVAADLGRDVGLNASQLGDLSAIWFAAFAVAQFPVGLALDRYGPRATIGGFMVMAALGAGWFSFATSFPAMLGAMALIGAGCAPVLMGSLYVFGRTVAPERFAMLASLMIGLGSIGNLAGAAPLAWAVTAFGWRASMLVIAGVTLAGTALVVALLRDPPPLAAAADGSVSPARYSSLFAPGPLWLLVPLVLVSYAFVIAIRSLWIAPFFGEVHGYGAVARGNAAFVMALAMSLGALAYGPIERALGSPRRTVMGGSVVAGLALVLLAWGGGSSPAAATVLFALFGFSGMTYGILMAHARRFIPANLLGRGVTLLNFVFIGGAGVVQWLSGRAVQAAADQGWTASSTHSALHGAFGVVLLAATAIYALSPESPARRPA